MFFLRSVCVKRRLCTANSSSTSCATIQTFSNKHESVQCMRERSRLDSLADAGDLEQLVTESRRLSARPQGLSSSHLYAILRASSTARDPECILAAIDALESRNANTLNTYECAIKGLSMSNQPSAALTVMEQMKSKIGYTSTPAIKAVLASHRLDHTTRRSLIAYLNPPSLRQSALVHLLRSVNEVRHIENTRRFDAHTHTAILCTYARLNSIENAMRVFSNCNIRMMSDEQIHSAVEALIALSLRANAPHVASQALEVIEGRSLVPDPQRYASVLYQGPKVIINLIELIRVFEHLLRIGLQPDISCFNAVLSSLSNTGVHMRRATARIHARRGLHVIVTSMDTLSVLGDTHTHMLLLRICAWMQSYSRARRTIDVMLSLNHSIQPIHVSLLIQSSAGAPLDVLTERVKFAEDLWTMHCLHSSVEPLLFAYSRLGAPFLEKTLQVYAMIPNVSSDAIMAMFRARQTRAGAQDAIEMMSVLITESAALRVHIGHYRATVACCGRARKAKLAYSAIAMFVERYGAAHSELAALHNSVIVGARSLAAARTAYTVMTKAGVRPDAFTLCNLLLAIVRDRRFDVFFDTVDELQNEGVLLTRSVCEKVIPILCYSRRIDFVVELLKRCKERAQVRTVYIAIRAAISLRDWSNAEAIVATSSIDITAWPAVAKALSDRMLPKNFLPMRPDWRAERSTWLPPSTDTAECDKNTQQSI